MVQPRWTIVMARIAPLGLLILVTISIIFVVLLNTSICVGKNDCHNLKCIFLKDQNTLDLIVPLRDSSEHFGKNNTQPIIHNTTQFIIQNISQITWPIKETIKYGISNGLIMIVNASSENEMKSILVTASQHHATNSQWDINGALDGYLGELFAELMDEVHNVEEAQDVVVETMKQCKCNDDLEPIQIQKNASEKKTYLIEDWPYKLQWYGQSLHSLVVFSSFRFTDSEFFIIALLGTFPLENSPVKESEPDSCAWISWQQNSINQSFANLNIKLQEKHMPTIQMGSQSITIANEPHGIAYDVAIIKCTFDDPAGANAEGGHLYIKKNKEFFPVFREVREEFNAIQLEGKFKYDFVYCSAPILWDLNGTYVKEWLMYHHFYFHAKKVHYFIYHGIDIDTKTMTVFDPFIRDGFLTLIDMRSPQSNLLGGQYPSHHLAINDCLHRVRFISKWVFLWSFEEYLIVSSQYTLSSILDKYKESPWISLGSMLWSIVYCCREDSNTTMLNKTMWTIDEMCFRMEHPTCNDKNYVMTCHGNEGQRKWIANPRLVFAASIHYALDPQSNGIVLDTNIARLNVYKGLLNPSLKGEICISIKSSQDYEDDKLLDGKWWKDLSMRDYTKAPKFYSARPKLSNFDLINPSPEWPIGVFENHTIV